MRSPLRHRCPHGHSGLSRREFIAATTALGATLWLPTSAHAGEFRVLSGKVRVNGRLAQSRTAVKPGDKVVTGADATVAFTVGNDAFLLSPNSSVELGRAQASNNKLIQGLRMLSGAILAVFEPGRPRRLSTPLMTIGIRGTGVFLEAGAEATTLCTCYGDVEVWDKSGTQRRRIISSYHTPIVAHADGLDDEPMMPMEPGKEMDMGHTDDELIMLEKLVGRVSPITLPKKRMEEAAEQG